MAAENFLTYTEVDPDEQISVAENKITFTNLSRAYSSYVYIDNEKGRMGKIENRHQYTLPNREYLRKKWGY